MTTTFTRWADVPVNQSRCTGREREATLVRVFVPGLVPGLLQTPAVTRWVCERLGGAADVDEVISRRRERQKLLGDPGRRFELLATSEALQAIPGDLFLDQVSRIDELNGLPGVEVRLARQSIWLHGFNLYDAPEPAVEIELESGELLVTGSDDVAKYVDRWERLWATAQRWDGETS